MPADSWIDTKHEGHERRLSKLHDEFVPLFPFSNFNSSHIGVLHFRYLKKPFNLSLHYISRIPICQWVSMVLSSSLSEKPALGFIPRLIFYMAERLCCSRLFNKTESIQVALWSADREALIPWRVRYVDYRRCSKPKKGKKERNILLASCLIMLWKQFSKKGHFRLADIRLDLIASYHFL